MAPVVFEDGFPCDPKSPNFAAHQAMSSDLANCAALWSTSAPATMLFPTYWSYSYSQRPDWLPAAAERLDWHMQQGPGRWTDCLRALLRFLLDHRTVLDPQTLLYLTKWGAVLQDNRGSHECYNLAGAIQRTLHAQAEALEASYALHLRAFSDHLVRVHCHGEETFQLEFLLFRQGWIQIAWAEELRDAKYKQLLDLSCHQWQSDGLPPKSEAKLRKAIEEIGEAEVAALLLRMLEGLEAGQPVQLSGAAKTLLRQILRWVRAVPVLASDDFLYRICALRWNADQYADLLMKEWLPELLATITLRPKVQRFACIERLMHNPQTMQFATIRALYDQLLADLSGVYSQASEGIDGYPLQSAVDHSIDSLLRAGTIIATRNLTISSQIEATLQLALTDLDAALLALNARVRWLKEHEPAPEEGGVRDTQWTLWSCDLGCLYIAILEAKPALSSEQLCELCRIDSLRWLTTSPASELFGACERHIALHGFDPELSGAMRAWAKTIHGNPWAQSRRKEIEWLLWFDTSAALETNTCWSAVIHKDLRSMSPSTRHPWLALLRNACFSQAVAPTQKWLKAAKKLLVAIDPEEFQRRIRAWFAPFENGQPLKITVPGRDILLTLLWYAQVANDPKIDEILPSLGQVKWKSKADRDRSARLLPVWIHAMSKRCPTRAIEAIHTYHASDQLPLKGKGLLLYKQLCEVQGQEAKIEAPPPPQLLDRSAFMQKQLGGFMTAMGGTTSQADADLVEIADPNGVTYQFHTGSGRILRLSDNKVVRLEIDWTSAPFRPFKHMMDSWDLNDPFQPNIFRTMLCVQILSGTLGEEVPIVVDES